ncbi:MAG: hypothetical protein A2374_03170 [Candidatus Moranbacteria bacterium RIFOXYB1_FULL_44_23]|nr:MAG: hypothetical protein A2194_03265 [Candidatus Moranbacteria bacterium RIFOXYA1_FULL_44_8]OGI35299.1 MAG: hypothetical protein A2407_01570 [Candidatus Moranbacteria bacterium RIFOXYC1_FULL_44_8]OGI39499.1 MAG: hypothetical protein A2374_03170 [Candidatus Moranbacteria bacterium RIFOXYB1_FULL_44_23]OGI42822.1 MAG: hypothetical protein A2593_00650 [Candidatus Moranbacteria bacterium RIFOXYD1_FULL_44_9]HBB36582.1 hypothetical protein [Candidatus Moranbacteria bacterium]
MIQLDIINFLYGIGLIQKSKIKNNNSKCKTYHIFYFMSILNFTMSFFILRFPFYIFYSIPFL